MLKFYLLLCAIGRGGVIGFLSISLEIHLQILNNALTLQILDFNALLYGGEKLVPVRTEVEGMNNCTGNKRVQLLPLKQIPQ